jgi:predicted DNA-binding transcriptional regulator AlpA
MSAAITAAPAAGKSPSNEALIDSNEVAGILNVSVASVLRWARTGELPGAVRFGRRTVRWKRTVIESIVAGRQVV